MNSKIIRHWKNAKFWGEGLGGKIMQEFWELSRRSQFFKTVWIIKTYLNSFLKRGIIWLILTFFKTNMHFSMQICLFREGVKKILRGGGSFFRGGYWPYSPFLVFLGGLEINSGISRGGYVMVKLTKNVYKMVKNRPTSSFYGGGGFPPYFCLI